MFLEECKNVVKEKKMSKHIIDNIEIFSDSDEENSNEENQNTFFIIFFIYKKCQINIMKNTKQDSKKKHEKRYENLFEEEKDKRQKKFG